MLQLTAPLELEVPMSDECLRLIQALQEKLRRTSQQLRATERGAAGAVMAAEEHSSRCCSITERHHKVSKVLEKAQFELDEEGRCKRALAEELEAVRAELAAAREHAAGLVPCDVHASLCADLEELRAELAEAESEGRELELRLAAAVASQRRRDRRLEAQVVARCEEERRRDPRNVHGASLSRAAEVSAKAVAEEQARDARRQQERLASVEERCASLEQELRSLVQQNTAVEQRLEGVRTRNRQLEGELRKVREHESEKEAALKAELRRQAQQLRVLSGVLRDSCFETSEGTTSLDLAQLCTPRKQPTPHSPPLVHSSPPVGATEVNGAWVASGLKHSVVLEVAV